MSKNENINAMLKELAIPESIKPFNYPIVDWYDLDGNVFAIIGACSKAWRKVDLGVSQRIMEVVNNHAQDYHEALAFLRAITNDAGDDTDEDNEETNWND